MPTRSVLLKSISSVHLIPLNLCCELMKNYLVENILIVQWLTYISDENFLCVHTSNIFKFLFNF